MNFCTKALVWVFLFCAVTDTYAQQGCIATNLNNTVINLPCTTNCTNLSFQIPHLKSTENYTVSSIPYAPYAYTTPTGTELTSLYIDDRYSPAISLPFNFCFYGANYNQVVVGSNGLITFDVSNASCANAYTISPQIPYNGTSQCAQFATYYPRAAIMGAYSDLDPSGSASPNDRKIEYRIEGTAPCRKFIASYYRVGVFGNNSCGRNTPNTFQIVIHETTGLVEVFFEQKACISATNSGRAILGIQNWDANQAVAAPGKNATIWNETNTAYRFTPSGATSRFVRSELLTMAGTVVATTTTGGSSTPGMLDISFSNICPATFPSQYVVRTIYRSCVDATEIFVNDTVTINRASTLTATASLTQPSCASANGTIAINATGGTTPYQYSLDGVNFQAGNSFTVPAGTYTVYVKDNGGCTFSLNATLNPSSGSTSSSFSASACSSYTLPWGAVVTTTGAYSNTYQTSSGCDSVVTANITINNATTSTTNTTICSSQLPYTWNGQTLTAGGTYTATLQSVSGCDSVATLNLTVNNGVTSTTNTTICNNQLPYTWNGQTLTAGGTYTATLQSASGCDSVATLNLTVNNAVTSTTNTTICNNQLPYTWNGQTLTAGGTYTATLQSASGCDSVATLNLTVNNAVTSTTNTTICNSQLPYIWNGQTLTAGGTYTATLQSASGCDSVATLNLTVNSGVTSTTNTTICNSQLPYTWNGQTLSTGGTYTATLQSASGCDSVATLNLTVNNAVTSTTNTTICDSQLPYTWNGQTLSTGGTYTATLQSASGCDSISTLNLTVNNAVTSTTNTTICNSQLPYTWNGQTLTAGGTYTVTLQSASGCDSVATLNLTVNNAVTSTTNTTICNSQLPYTWNGQTLSTEGTYTATLQSASGCDSVATLNLTVNNAVTSTTNTTICNSQLPYTWNGQTLTGGGTYTVTLQSASGCDSVATLNLTVNNGVTSTTNTTICNSQLPYTWNGQTLTAGGTYTATLQSASGCDSVATLNLIVNNGVTSTTNTTICNSQLPYTWNGQTLTSGGTYTATLQSASGCDSVATLNLTVNNAVASTTNTTICNSQLPYTWNGQTLTGGGTYTVTLQSASGCDSVATLNLTVNNAVTSTTNTTICNNQLPYTWNGQTLTAGGTYTATLQSASGCDSVATLNLTVNSGVTSTTNTTICNTQLPYTWNGQTLTVGGTYTATLQSASGCDSVATLNLTVNSGVTSTTNTTICNSQLPYTWNGQTLTAGGTYTATLQSASGCDSVATLNLTVNSGVTSTTNTTICNSQLPYTWNGQTLTAGGTYTATLQSASGCDSVATLNLTVNNAVTSTTNTNICNTLLPYTWNGQSLTAGGTYTATLQSASGCDSVATLNLTVNSGVTSTTNTTICNSQLPYTWNGQTLTAGGTYTATLQSAAGCDSVATLNLIVNSGVTSTTNTTICNSQLPYTWNGQTLTAGGTYTTTLQSASGCDSVATLNLNVNNTVTSTTNTTICNNQLPYTWNGQTLTAGGTYTATLQSASGCDSVATLNLTVNNGVTSTTNTTICNNQLPYTWNGQTLTAGGTYTATLQSASGCDSVATLNLTVNNTVTSTTNTTICNNQLPYTWNGQTLTAGGTYIATLQSASGCDSVATLNLTVNNVVTSTTNTTICNSQLPYTWNGQTLTGGGTYTVTLQSASGCDSVATLNLTVNNVVTSTINTTICNSQLPYTWNGQMLTAGGTYTATLQSASGCDSVAILNLTVNSGVTNTTNTTICNNQLPYTWNGQTLTAGGTYTVTLQSASGCDSIATLNLTVNNAVTSTTNTTICNSQLPYTWNGQTLTGGGTYTATLQSASGCDSVATLNLTVNNTVTSTTNTTICNSQLPYTWNGQTLTTGGTYTATLQSASGCDSVSTLNLIVNSGVTSTTNTTICNSQLPFTWNGQTLTTGGTYTATLQSVAGCDSVATLNLIVNSGVTSTTNTTICNSQLPYTWNGQTLTAGGTYTVTLQSISGCDSIATLILVVNNAINTTSNITVCNNQLPYTWNGQNLNAAGTYLDTLQSSSGCDSIATLNLTVNNVVTIITDTSICSNQLPFIWNNQNLTQGGIYTDTLLTNANCDVINILNLTVTDVVSGTTNISICNSQLPYSWNGQLYNTEGTFIDTLQSASGCDSVATLILSVNNIVTNTTNLTICSEDLPYSWNGQSLTAPGSYTDTLQSISGCDSVATLNLVIIITDYVTTDLTICSNQLPYSWYGLTINQAGIYTDTLEGNPGCDTILTLNLWVNDVVSSTTNATICNSQLPYTWNGQTLTAGGTYTDTIQNASGCDSVAILNLTVNNILTSTTNETICSTQLPYTWNGQTYTAAGTYSVTLQSTSGCDSIATLNLVVTPTADASLSASSTICEGESKNLSIQLTGTPPWSLTYTDGVNQVTLNNIMSSPYNLTVSPRQTTTYTLLSVSDVKCTNSTLNSSITVDVSPRVYGITYTPVDINSNVPVQLSAREPAPGYSYKWTPAIGLSQSNIKSPIFQYTNSVIYQIELTSAAGCKTVDTLAVNVIQMSAIPLKGDLYVPKAWSPNGDGSNDYLYPLITRVRELKYFRVYNRWGQLVFETNVIGHGWDGIFKGQKQMVDNYSWVAEAIGEDGRPILRSGNVLLLK